jgi:hopene-associated glycosyltransferase HpnB
LPALAALGLAAWASLLVARGGFWLARERIDTPPDRARWPAVVAIVPARNEADVIGRSIRSLLDQDYPGPFHIVLVDDHSRDGTAEIARDVARAHPQGARLTIHRAAPLPPGWVGKIWALFQGLRRADDISQAPFVWLTDADIEHDSANLRRLVARAESENRALVSLMVLLSCAGFWERLLIPPFVFFFQKLYPFAWVNDPKRRTAAAAGGCVLVRRAALDAAGGLEAIKAEIIDDCALARRVKAAGHASLWLGLTTEVRSIRPYEGLAGIWSMVARSAYTQLRHSPWRLAGTVLGMALVYIAPPLLVLTYPLHGQALAAALGGLAWLLMSIAVLPTLRLYGQPARLAPLLPLAALLYSAMTLDSGLAHRRGRGGAWKGRVQGNVRREGGMLREGDAPGADGAAGSKAPP